MKERISQLMDGELDERAAAELIAACGRGGEALQTWRMYHLVGDAVRETRVLSRGFSARVAERLAAEPTVLAPKRMPAESRTWFALSAAASLAAMALVGWLAFAPQPGGEPQLAKAPAKAQPAMAQAQPPAMSPSTANEYLLAHQGFSPRVSFQGMAPYVRTVAEQSREPRK